MANLILVLEAHVTAHSTAPGARLWDGLDRPSEHDVNGRPQSHFQPGTALPNRGGSGLWDTEPDSREMRRPLRTSPSGCGEVPGRARQGAPGWVPCRAVVEPGPLRRTLTSVGPARSLVEPSQDKGGRCDKPWG
jgi:hypothetical protein